MAGLYHSEKGSEIPTFVILTKAAAPNIAFIHDRMPVILGREAQLSWLNGDTEVIIALDNLLYNEA